MAHDCNPLISILIPTKNREEKLKRCLREIKDKTEYPNYEIVVEVEPNGQEYTFLQDFAALNNMREIVVLRPHENLFLHTAWILLASAASGENVAVFNDDMFPDPGWLTHAMNEMKARFPAGGFIGFCHNGVFNDSGVITGLFSKKLFYDFLITPPGEYYYHYFQDNEWTDRANALGIHFKSDKAIIWHEYRKEMDITYTDGDKYFELDRAIYERRMRKLGLWKKKE